MAVSIIAFVLARFVDHAGDLVLMILLIAIFAALEWMFPAERSQTIRGRVRNLEFMAIFQLGGGIFVSLVAYVVLPHLLLPSEAIPDRSPLERAGLIVFFIFLGDAVFYWYHRAQHSVAWLWVIHELHHSDSELNATSSLRTYLLERPIQFLAISLPIAVLISRTPGLDKLSLTADEASTSYVVSLTWLFFAHANLRLQLGRLSWIGTAPQVHRIHHSIEAGHQQKNFAQFFPVLDVAFRTYCAPRRGEFPRTGPEGAPARSPLAHVLLEPLRHWLRPVFGPTTSPLEDVRAAPASKEGACVCEGERAYSASSQTRR